MSAPVPISVRLAGPEDPAAIAGLVAELAAELGERSPITPAFVAKVLVQQTCQILLAVRGGELLGLLSFSFRPSLFHAADSCLIDELVVEPGARNQGIGAVLLDDATRRAREHGCAEASLSVMSSNAGALRFYQRRGFEADALLLERHFPPSEA
jgi:ribosomal protein S18 acetylase RimI-like enzyme